MGRGWCMEGRFACGERESGGVREGGVFFCFFVFFKSRHLPNHQELHLLLLTKNLHFEQEYC